jgi:uncharacterized protein
MNKKEIIEKTKEFVKEKLGSDSSGHDYWHAIRVYKTAKTIAKEEKKTYPDIDLFLIDISALLHDIADWKYTDGDENEGPRVAGEWLRNNNVDESTIENVSDIIKKISFKGAKVKNQMVLYEGKIVQDADRLDAIGAIGIARTFAYGGSKGRQMYDPDIKPQLHDSSKKYMTNSSPTINHFYEKLLLLKGMMNTKTAKEMAEVRHNFMLLFLDEFYREWDGK